MTGASFEWKVDAVRTSASTWIADNALNAIAYVALRLAPPNRAKRWVERFGRVYPVLRSIEDARAMAHRLGGRGTCLSRSLAVAARCPGSEVVIGAIEPRKDASTPAGDRPLDAHAWVEVSGVPLLDGKPRWRELGRLVLRS